MDIEVTTIKAGVPTVNGRVYSREVLEEVVMDISNHPVLVYEGVDEENLNLTGIVGGVLHAKITIEGRLALSVDLKDGIERDDILLVDLVCEARVGEDGDVKAPHVRGVRIQLKGEMNRPRVSTEEIERGLQNLSTVLHGRIQQKGDHAFVSRHEVLGVIEEEMYELHSAVGSREQVCVCRELIDVAVACVFGVISSDHWDW